MKPTLKDIQDNAKKPDAVSDVATQLGTFFCYVISAGAAAMVVISLIKILL